jgi:exopolysaccharide biosynthesis polyprenyl glycosylphosphotransferase
MKNPDDGTLSLFDDFPAAYTPPAAAIESAAKKSRAKRKATKPADVETPATQDAAEPAQTIETTEANHAAATDSPTPNDAEQDNDNHTHVEATLHYANLLEPQRRRNSPWSNLDMAALQTAAIKPHVMLVISKGEAGGAQSHVLALCQSLQTKVNFTVVIGGPADSTLAHQLSDMGIDVYPLPAITQTLNPLKLLPAVQQLQALIAQHKPDMVHAHSAIAGVVARLAALRAGVPAIYTVHGFGFKPEVPWLQRSMSSLAERALARWTAQMLCVSQHERNLAYSLPIDSDRIHVIPNGLPLLPSAPTDSDGRQQVADASTVNAAPSNASIAHHDEATPRLIMVARMAAPKRHDLLIQALALVRNSLGRELPVTFAGDGPLLAQHQALAQSLDLQAITWAGDVADVPALLAQHEVFVLLSDHEGMPITVLEAMRAGLCVLASDLPGTREQIAPNQDGVLVSPHPQAVAEQLLRIAKEPQLRKRLGKAAQQTFETQFTAKQMADRVLQVYRDGFKATQASPEANTPHSGLASASVRRRDALLGWSLWGAWLLLPSWVAAQLLQDAGLVTYQFGDTVMWCVLAYAVAANLLLRAVHLPVAERGGVLLVATTAPFVFTPLGFALLQQPYSRAGLLWAYALTTAWLWWGYQRHVKHRALRLIYVDPNVPAQLGACLVPESLDTQALQLTPWNPNSHTPLPACDGVVLDRHVRSTDARTQLLSQLKMQHLRLYSVEAVAELSSGRKVLPTAADSLWEVDNDPAYDRAKRFIDVAMVVLLAPIWLPLALGVAMAVRFDSKGPALYSQPRVGRDGHVFTLWKFRSMVHGLQAPGVHFAQADDPRITRVGRFIRRTRLDELPQLFNVLMGHMSLIGPRPEQTAFVRDFAASIPSYPYRHLVRPGLTGWAQVQQGYADSADTTRVKLSYDLYYVAHYSLALDLLIAVKTVRTVFTGFGAR